MEGAGNAGNSNLQAFDYNFGEGKQEGQTPNSEGTDFHGIGVEEGVVEVGSEQVAEDQVGQGGMAGKKPCPNPLNHLQFPDTSDSIQLNSTIKSCALYQTVEERP